MFLYTKVRFWVLLEGQNTKILRFFFALFGAQKPKSGVENFPKKKIFFFRFFDFLTRRWPIQNALVVQKMAGELTLDAQNRLILAFFDFLVPEGYIGCSEQASKTLVKKNFWDFFFLRFLKNRPILRPILAGEFRRPKGPPFGFFQKIGYFLCTNSTRSKCRSKWGAGQITYPILTGYYLYTKIPDFFGNF